MITLQQLNILSWNFYYELQRQGHTFPEIFRQIGSSEQKKFWQGALKIKVYLFFVPYAVKQITFSFDASLPRTLSYNEWRKLFGEWVARPKKWQEKITRVEFFLERLDTVWSLMTDLLGSFQPNWASNLLIAISFSLSEWNKCVLKDRLRCSNPSDDETLRVKPTNQKPIDFLTVPFEGLKSQIIAVLERTSYPLQHFNFRFPRVLTGHSLFFFNRWTHLDLICLSVGDQRGNDCSIQWLLLRMKCRVPHRKTRLIDRRRSMDRSV